MEFNIIVCVDEEGGFGKDGKIPWHYPNDLKHFKEITNGSTCIMGLYTYKDIMEMRKISDTDELLPGRDAIVISTTTESLPNAKVAKDLREASYMADQSKQMFVIGGERMFRAALPFTKSIHMTIVPGLHKCDRHFPLKYLDKNFNLTDGKKDGELMFVTYARI